jgi:delta(3,5)-delta(2,4)-dienoyl-CoA isomerase
MAPFPDSRFFKITFPAEYVAHVEINRPEKLNSFCTLMWYELKAIFDRLSHHPDVRCVLLSAAGDRAFTAGALYWRGTTGLFELINIAGLDIEEASSGDCTLSTNAFSDPSRKATALRRRILEYQGVISSVARCEKPVVGLLHGYTYGLGIDLSSACDIRLCAPDTKFCVKEIDVGFAADVGTLSRLPKVAGGLTSWVKEICLSARPFSAQEAVENRFVSRVVSGGKQELFQEGLRIARRISSKSPVAVQGTKNILDAAWGRPVEENLNYTAVWNMGMVQSSDMGRALRSGLEKKTTTFEKL